MSSGAVDRAALKYMSGVGAEPTPPRFGPSSEANVMWPGMPFTPAPPRALARFLTSSAQGLSVMAKAFPDRAVLEDIVKVTLAALRRQRAIPKSDTFRSRPSASLSRKPYASH